MIAATNGWIIPLDNLSHLSPWLSDALCRLSTGGGFSTRELYSDFEEVIFDCQRPVILTGIEEVATRGDLLDRSLIVTLPNIPEERRRPESEIWREFDEARPRLLGVLYDAISVALRNLPTTTVDRLPRMADFALWATAAESALAMQPGGFMAAYSGNRQAGNELALEASPVGKILMDFTAGTSHWTGKASDLLTELEGHADDRTRRSRSWPSSGRALSGILKRLAPNFRSVGVEVEMGRTGKGRYVTIGRVGEKCVITDMTVADPQKQAVFAQVGDATMMMGDAKPNRGDDGKTPENAASDDDGAKFPLHSAADCEHPDVEETLTHDGYVNRQCRQCGEDLPCRKLER